MLSNIKVKRKSDNFEAAENKIPAAAERGKMTEEKTAENVENVLYLGIDVGSTTVKAVVVDDKEKVLFSTYQRHMSEVRQKIISILEQAAAKFPRQKFCLSLTGSGALSLCNGLNIPFVQEVIASSLAIKKQIPDADVVVELGGEDAKLTFLTSGTDLRMNETCAGGTGAFIDQMEKYVPGSRTSMRKFFDLAEEVRLAQAYTSSVNGNADSKIMVRDYGNCVRAGSYSVNEVFKALKMPLKARQILSAYWCYLGASLDDMSFVHYASMVNRYIMRGASTPNRAQFVGNQGILSEK